ncbi:MAG: response regulator transcription factor [Acidobacteriota bacterium]
MKILVAEDEAVSRRVLQAALEAWGFEVVVAEDGEQAWEVLSSESPPPMALLDWMMPGLTGLELVKRARQEVAHAGSYLIMVTGRSERADIVEALEAGADDHVSKPFDLTELRARVSVGRRVVGLQGELASRVRELETALAEVQRLGKLLPICCYCKKIRDDQNYWQEVEQYVSGRTGTEFTHGICPACLERVLAE